MNETSRLAASQEQSRRVLWDDDWTQKALHLATFPVGLPNVGWPDSAGPKVETVAATKPQSLPFIDDNGQPVVIPSGPLKGQIMQHPASFDPHFFIARGLEARQRREAADQLAAGSGADFASGARLAILCKKRKIC